MLWNNKSFKLNWIQIFWSCFCFVSICSTFEIRQSRSTFKIRCRRRRMRKVSHRLNDKFIEEAKPISQIGNEVVRCTDISNQFFYLGGGATFKSNTKIYRNSLASKWVCKFWRLLFGNFSGLILENLIFGEVFWE